MEDILLKRIDAYYEKDAINQSMLKALLAGIGTYQKEEKDKFREDSQHFILGGAVDSLLLLPEGAFNSRYYLSTLENKPSDTVMSITREVFAKRQAGNMFASNKEAIWEACNSRSYFINRKKDDYNEDKRVDGILKDGADYWNELVEANGRTILTTEDKELIDTIVDSFRTHPHTKKYFQNDDDVISIPQVDIYFTYRGHQCKALLDLVLVDHKRKLIQPIDIKTVGESTKAFPKSARRFRYDIQGAWYTLALYETNFLKINEYQTIDMSEYVILPFKFIVESTTSPGICPLVYTMSPLDTYIAQHGTTVYKGSILDSELLELPLNQEINGFEQGLDVYEWHELNDQWEMDKQIFEQEGEMLLEIWK